MRRHEEAVAAVRKASFPRRVAIALVASLAFLFIVSASLLLSRVDSLQVALAESIDRSARLRAIEVKALELERLGLLTGANAPSNEARVALDELITELDAVAAISGLPEGASRRVSEARDHLAGLRARVESGSPVSARFAASFDAIRALSSARESVRAVSADLWRDILAAWRTMNLALIASCVIAAILTVVFALALRRGDALRVAAHEMEAAFERAPAGIALCDDAGIVHRVNDGFVRLAGKSVPTILGASLGRCEAIPCDRPPEGFERVVRAGASGGRFEMMTRAIGDDLRELSCEMRPVSDPRGHGALWAVRVDDVTEQRRALAALAERADLLNALLEASRDGMLLIAPNGKIVFANQSFADLVGVDSDSLLGLPARDLAARLAERALDAPDAFRRLFGESDDERNGSVLPFRTAIRVPGIRVLLASAVPVSGEGGNWLGRLAMVRDVTQEEKAKRAKEVFLGNVSHELRTPLTSIAGFAEILASDKVGGVNERQREMLQIIGESVTRLSSLVDDVLAVGGLEEERPVWGRVDLTELIEEIVSLERGAAEQKGLRIGLSQIGDCKVIGDARRLRHLFSNLVSNAVKYTRAGEVRIEIDARESAFVSIEVTDTGIGIDEVDRTRIFERFFRASNPDTRAIRGTGLGLAIAKLVCDQHDGRIEVESVRGKGSTFRVLLPRTREDAIPAPREGPTPVRRARPLVLAIDDDVLAHRIIAAALRVCGIDVVCAETASQGIKAATELRPDALLVDVELPDSSGYDVIARLRRDHGLGDTPFVVISGREPPPSLAALGVAAYLQKPVRSERLREAMIRVLGDSRVLVNVPTQGESGVI